VGEQISSHVSIEDVRLNPNGQSGVLILRAESTAWATQVRILIPQIHEQIRADFGADVISEIQVLGPTAPSWKHGLRSTPGRGPRDTYG
jgi:predicted nucleic acid-binding Zn ribbon protein